MNHKDKKSLSKEFHIKLLSQIKEFMNRLSKQYLSNKG